MDDDISPLQRICSAMARGSFPRSDPNQLTAPERGGMRQRAKWELYMNMGIAVLAELGLSREEMDVPRGKLLVPPENAVVLVPWAGRP